MWPAGLGREVQPTYSTRPPRKSISPSRSNPEHECIADLQLVDGRPQGAHVFDGRAVDGVNHVSGLQLPFPRGWSGARSGRHHDPGRHPKVGQQRAERLAEGQAEDTEAPDEMLIGTHHPGEPVRVVAALDDGHGNVERPGAAQNLQLHDVADRPAIEVDLQLAAVLHRLAVERGHDISRFQPGTGRRARRG